MKKKTDTLIEEGEKQEDVWREKYLRALADYHNLEKRTQAEKNQIRRYAAESILERLLPVVDTFERAHAHLGDQGLALAMKDLYAVLAQHGVRRMDAVGKAFNPHEMECVELAEGKENMVISEVLPGYTLHGKILRVAKVKVGKQERDQQAEERAKEQLQKGD